MKGRTVRLLDVTVRTDTRACCDGVSWGVRGLKTQAYGSGPYLPIQCDICGMPIRRCRCRVTVDY